jgi:hypothetical protein
MLLSKSESCITMAGISCKRSNGFLRRLDTTDSQFVFSKCRYFASHWQASQAVALDLCRNGAFTVVFRGQ